MKLKLTQKKKKQFKLINFCYLYRFHGSIFNRDLLLSYQKI